MTNRNIVCELESNSNGKRIMFMDPFKSISFAFPRPFRNMKVDFVDTLSNGNLMIAGRFNGQKGVFFFSLVKKITKLDIIPFILTHSRADLVFKNVY